jgi:hypothetical protein
MLYVAAKLLRASNGGAVQICSTIIVLTAMYLQQHLHMLHVVGCISQRQHIAQFSSATKHILQNRRMLITLIYSLWL